MSNMPEVKLGVVAVSRDCFPESLSVSRRQNLVKAYTEKYGTEGIYECPVCIVESEIHMVQALEDIKKAGCNALCVYLGNFGPEISETLLAKHFDGPKMFIAAAEESGDNLLDGRGDAYRAGLLSGRKSGGSLPTAESQCARLHVSWQQSGQLRTVVDDGPCHRRGLSRLL